jgi:hypothetical protein
MEKTEFANNSLPLGDFLNRPEICLGGDCTFYEEENELKSIAGSEEGFLTEIKRGSNLGCGGYHFKK